MNGLNELQMDLLKEAFNLGVGQAAYALSEIASGEEIELSVPQLSIKTIHELAGEVTKTSGDQVCGVSEDFSGPFDGSTLMLYSQEESLELVRIMLHETIPVEHLSEMEGEALCEVGNIVLNACISSLANLFECEIRTDIPKLHIGGCEEVLSKAMHLGGSSHVLHLRMDFNLSKHRLNGHIGFFLGMASVKAIADQLDSYLQRMMGN